MVRQHKKITSTIIQKVRFFKLQQEQGHSNSRVTSNSKIFSNSREASNSTETIKRREANQSRDTNNSRDTNKSRDARNVGNTNKKRKKMAKPEGKASTAETLATSGTPVTKP
jgi:hypothetical protein